MKNKIEINRETRLADLLKEYPWLKDEITTVNEKFKMLASPLGAVMAKKATVADMSEKSGMDESELIDKLEEIIAAHDEETPAVTGDMLVGRIVTEYPEAIETLLECGMHCLGCPSSQMESLNDACMVHGLNPDDVAGKVNAAIKAAKQ